MLKSFAGGRLFGGTWGAGTPDVLALHGWARSHLDFDPVFRDQAFEAAAGAVALDLPGFGATPAPPVAWGSDEYAADLVPVFDELAERVVVVGHSFGGRVAVRLASLVPDRIERLVLTGVPLLPRAGRRTRPPLPYRVGRRMHGWGLVGEARMEALRNRYGSPDYRAAQGVVRQVLVRVLAEDYQADLAGLRCPVDLVWGADDTEVPVEVAEQAQGIVPVASLRTYPGVGHLTPTEMPAELRAVILAARPGRSSPLPRSVRPTGPAPSGAPGSGAPSTGGAPS